MTHFLAGAATNRRRFLGLVGLGAAAMAGGGLLSACSREAGTTGAATNVDAVTAVLPKYTPMDLVKPDIDGIPPVADGFLRYPTNLVDAITEKPGAGGTPIKAMTPWWGPVPPGIGKNAYLDGVNADLGTPIDFSVQDGNTYADKLNAMLGARDVPEVLCVPSWEIAKIPRFSDAVNALFEDLTGHLKGDAVAPYAMLANLPTGAWRHAVWDGKLSAIPWPTDGPFPWALFYRKDLFDRAGVAMPTTIDELYEAGKKMTDPAKGVWAFNGIFDMVQMYFKCPGSEGGWRRNPDGSLVHKYETPEFKEAVEFTERLYREKLVHPDIVASKGADAKQLFRGGKIVFLQDGPGAWQGMQRDEQAITPGFNMQPVPVFSATGGDPLVWGSSKPIFYTFLKKGLGEERTTELLRVLNWCAAPFGTREWELREYGVEGTHFTRGPDGAPKTNDLYSKEFANQYGFVVGRAPALVSSADTPNYVRDLLTFSNAMVQHLEENPWDGIKLELPANYSKIQVPTEEKITDVLRGRRPISDLDGIISEWRSTGGEEGREFLAKALADSGR